jgi:hypothetical protein
MPADFATVFIEDQNLVIKHTAILDCLQNNGDLEYTAIEQQPEPGKKGILFTIWAKEIKTYMTIGRLMAQSMMEENG